MRILAAMPRKTNEPPGPIARFRRHEHLTRSGEVQDSIFCIEEGWVGRYTLLGAGRRQITALYLPGDYCEPQWIIRPRSTESIVALTPVRAWRKPVVRLTEADRYSPESRELIGALPKIIERQSAWIIALGRKTALERISTLMVEFMERLKAGGRGQGERFPMPLTQTEIGDVVGLTPIHVNRVMKDLKTRGIIEVKRRFVTVHDQAELRAIADSDQLH